MWRNHITTVSEKNLLQTKGMYGTVFESNMTHVCGSVFGKKMHATVSQRCARGQNLSTLFPQIWQVHFCQMNLHEIL